MRSNCVPSSSTMRAMPSPPSGIARGDRRRSLGGAARGTPARAAAWRARSRRASSVRSARCSVSTRACDCATANVPAPTSACSAIEVAVRHREVAAHLGDQQRGRAPSRPSTSRITASSGSASSSGSSPIASSLWRIDSAPNERARRQSRPLGAAPFERAARDAEQLRGARLVAVDRLQHGEDVALFECRAGRSSPAAALRRRWRRRGTAPTRSARRGSASVRSGCAARARCPASRTGSR